MFSLLITQEIKVFKLEDSENLHQPDEVKWTHSRPHHQLHGNDFSFCFAFSVCLSFCCTSVICCLTFRLSFLFCCIHKHIAKTVSENVEWIFQNVCLHYLQLAAIFNTLLFCSQTSYYFLMDWLLFLIDFPWCTWCFTSGHWLQFSLCSLLFYCILSSMSCVVQWLCKCLNALHIEGLSAYVYS